MPEGVFYPPIPSCQLPSLCYLTTGLPVVISSLVFLPLILLSIHFRGHCHLALSKIPPQPPHVLTLTAHIPYRLPSALIRSCERLFTASPQQPQKLCSQSKPTTSLHFPASASGSRRVCPLLDNLSSLFLPFSRVTHSPISISIHSACTAVQLGCALRLSFHVICVAVMCSLSSRVSLGAGIMSVNPYNLRNILYLEGV